MRKIWLLLAIFLLAAGVFTTTLLVPDFFAHAQSTPNPTEEP